MTPTTCDCAGCTLACCTRRNAEIADQLRAAKVHVLLEAAIEAERENWSSGFASDLRRMAEEIATSDPQN
jgi:hypothetical protein